jgi:hypothetical protein
VRESPPISVAGRPTPARAPHDPVALVAAQNPTHRLHVLTGALGDRRGEALPGPQRVDHGLAGVLAHDANPTGARPRSAAVSRSSSIANRSATGVAAVSRRLAPRSRSHASA